MGDILEKHAAPIADTCPLIAQSSTMGVLGTGGVSDWCKEVTKSFCRDSGTRRYNSDAGFKMVFPSYQNVMAGHDGILSGGGLPYRQEQHAKQTWLKDHLCQWRADSRCRSHALPHIKSYCRYSEEEGLYWFCLTSANFSKSAWGGMNTGGGGWKYKRYRDREEEEPGLRVNNYEMGVLFLPRLMINRDTFPLTYEEDSEVAPFPMPFDLPLVPYSHRDQPWFYNHLMRYLDQKEADTKGA